MPSVQDILVRLNRLLRSRNSASFNRENNPSVVIPIAGTLVVDIFGWKAYNVYVENTHATTTGMVSIVRRKDIFDTTVEELVAQPTLAPGEVATLCSDCPGTSLTISEVPNGGITIKAAVVKVA